jgi:hypothetical protein
LNQKKFEDTKRNNQRRSLKIPKESSEEFVDIKGVIRRRV